MSVGCDSDVSAGTELQLGEVPKTYWDGYFAPRCGRYGM